MKPDTTCRHRPLAKGPHTRVTRCSHGTVPLSVGSLTLRLSEREFLELGATVGRATERLASTHRSAQAPVTLN